MEVSGPLLQAAAPATVSLEEQSYKVKIAQIRAGNLKDSEKQMQIKKLTHEVMLNLMKSEVSAPTPVLTTESIQKFGKIVAELPLALVLRVMSFIERLSLNDANGIRHKFTPLKPYFNPITSSQFLVLVRECLTKREKTKLNELLAPFVTNPKRPADDEIERCFGSIGVDFMNTCLEKIVRAIQVGLPSKEDVEITARVIKREMVHLDLMGSLLNIDRGFEFTTFSEDYDEELRKDLKRVGIPKRNILVLDFTLSYIGLIPNILGAFKNLQTLSFNGCNYLSLPPSIEDCTSLKALDFTNCTSLLAPPDLTGNPNLRYLSFWKCKSLTHSSDLSGNEKLTHLYLTYCTRLKMPGLSKLTKLRALDVRGVFPENPELNREVEDNQVEAQALIRAIEAYRFDSQVINLDVGLVAEEALDQDPLSLDEDPAEAQLHALPEVEKAQERKSRCRFNSGCHIL